MILNATQSASAVLAATMSPTLHPSGFRISDRPVAASFAHPYSFQPVTDFLQRDEACLTSTLSLGGVEGTWVRYWDESSTVAALEFKVEEPIQPTSQVKEKEKKKKPKGD
jgi:RNA-binding protein 5/10